MRILIIGGTGFTGPHVVRRLSALEYKVVLLHRGETEADLPPDVEHLHHPSFNSGEREGFGQFAETFRRLSPDVVLDMVPCTERGAQAVMQAFKGMAGRVVALSSIDVYRAYGRLHRTEPGPIDPIPLSEDAPLRETNQPHGATYDKIAVERIVMGEPELPGTILRLPAIYGPTDYQHRLFGYLKRMDDGRPAILLNAAIAKWRWSRGYVENVAEAIVLAVTESRSTGRVYNVAEREALSEAEWVKRIASAAGWKGAVVVVPEPGPAWLDWGINTDQDWVVDTTRIRQELGYKETVPQAEALRRSVEWDRANPPTKINVEHFDYAREDAFLGELRGQKAG